MDLHLEPPGFLGTGASLLADLSLLAYLLLIIPLLLIGVFYARRGLHRPHHKWIMIGITAINWLLILLLMIASYRLDVTEGIFREPGEFRYLLPTIHGILGLPAQLLATYVVYRMLREDFQIARAKKRGETDVERYWFKQAKWTMWVITGLWLLTMLFGVSTYLVRYNILEVEALDLVVPPPVDTEEPGIDPPVATEDVALDVDEIPCIDSPLATEEAQPNATPDPLATPCVVPPLATEAVAPPVNTEEVNVVPPVSTEEIRDDDEDDDDDSGQGRGRGRGRGRGSDDDEEDDD
ncbi:MAG: hypothetical protein K8L99_25515 [Anaerolineae bacterium]|nr:hypothetical protein [Anaerolineae bacterium]